MRITAPADLRPGDHLHIAGLYAKSEQRPVVYRRKLPGEWHQVSYQGADPASQARFSVHTDELRLSRSWRPRPGA